MSGGRDRYLEWKVGLFFLGAGFLVAGMATGRSWPVAVATAALVGGVLMRFLSRGSED